MKNIIKYLFILSLLVGYTACEKDKPVLIYEGSDFIFFNDVDASVGESNTAVNYIFVKLAADQQSATVTVDFAISGDAVEGTDYEILNTTKSLTFASGYYTDTIKIKSINNTIQDGNKLITFTLSNGGSFNLGYPGPDSNNSIFEFTIIDDDCAFDPSIFAGTPSGVDKYANYPEFNSSVSTKLISDDGTVAVYELTGIMVEQANSWDEAILEQPPVTLTVDYTDPYNPVPSLGSTPQLALKTNGGGEDWYYQVSDNPDQTNIIQTCPRYVEIYYLMDGYYSGGTFQNPGYLKLTFGEE